MLRFDVGDCKLDDLQSEQSIEETRKKASYSCETLISNVGSGWLRPDAPSLTQTIIVQTVYCMQSQNFGGRRVFLKEYGQGCFSGCR